MPHSQAAPTKSRRHAARMVFPTDLSTCSVHNPPGLPRPKSQKDLTGLGKHADHMKRVHPHKVIHIGRGGYIVQQTLFRQLVAVGFASGVRVAVDKWGRPAASLRSDRFVAARHARIDHRPGDANVAASVHCRHVTSPRSRPSYRNRRHCVGASTQCNRGTFFRCANAVE